MMKGADTVILLAGLAGGTGGGAISFIALLALHLGAKTIAVVTTPPNIITSVGMIEGKKKPRARRKSSCRSRTRFYVSRRAR